MLMVMESEWNELLEFKHKAEELTLRLEEMRIERDFWEEERRKAGLEAFELGEKLGRAEEACKRLREKVLSHTHKVVKAIADISQLRKDLADFKQANQSHIKDNEALRQDLQKEREETRRLMDILAGYDPEKYGPAAEANWGRVS